MSGLTVEEHEEIVRNILEYFPLHELNPTDDHRLLELMRHDKKNVKGEIRMVLLKSIGVCYTGKTVETTDILSALEYYRSLATAEL